MLLSFFPLSAVIFSIISVIRLWLHLAARVGGTVCLSLYRLLSSLLSCRACLLSCGRIGLVSHAACLPISALDMVRPTSRGATHDDAPCCCAVRLRASKKRPQARQSDCRRFMRTFTHRDAINPLYRLSYHL